MKEFDIAQVEQLKSIGAYLSQERQKRGVSLEEIALKTYIPLRLLQALDLGQVERLPEPVFVQGFIRRYADAIDLDGTALAKTFVPQQSFVVERKATELELSETSDHSISTQEPPEASIDHTPHPIDPAPRTNRRSPLPFVLLGTAAALLLGVGVMSVLNRPQTEEPQPSDTTQTKPASPNSAAKPESPAPPLASSSPAPGLSPQTGEAAKPSPTPTPSTPIQVAVNLTGESWLQVIADGKTEFEGILKKGDQKTWTAQKKLVLQSGNAGAVSVSYNQGEAKLLGSPGEVKDMTYPSNPAQAKTN